MIGFSYTLPAGILPFHLTMNGTRVPPSQVVALKPRSGPFFEVVLAVGPPLSARKKMSVFSSCADLLDLGEHAADGVVHRRHHGGKHLPLAFDVREAVEVLLRRLQRGVLGVERQVQEEGLVLVLLDPVDGPLGVGVGRVEVRRRSPAVTCRPTRESTKFGGLKNGVLATVP